MTHRELIKQVLDVMAQQTEIVGPTARGTRAAIAGAKKEGRRSVQILGGTNTTTAVAGHYLSGSSPHLIHFSL